MFDVGDRSEVLPNVYEQEQQQPETYTTYYEGLYVEVI